MTDFQEIGESKFDLRKIHAGGARLSRAVSWVQDFSLVYFRSRRRAQSRIPLPSLSSWHSLAEA